MVCISRGPEPHQGLTGSPTAPNSVVTKSARGGGGGGGGGGRGWGGGGGGGGGGGVG